MDVLRLDVSERHQKQMEGSASLVIDLIGKLLTDAEQVFDDLGLTPAQGRNVKGIALACVPFVDAIGIVGNY